MSTLLLMMNCLLLLDHSEGAARLPRPNLFHLVTDVWLPHFLCTGALHPTLHALSTSSNIQYISDIRMDQVKSLEYQYDRRQVGIIVLDKLISSRIQRAKGCKLNISCETQAFIFNSDVLTFHRAPFITRFLDQLTVGLSVPRGRSFLSIVLVRRSQKRRILNLESIFENMQASFPHLNVHVVDFERLPLREAISLVASSEVLIGAHGAGLTNLIFMKPKSSVVEIFPPGFQRCSYKQLAHIASVSYTAIYGEHDGHTPPNVCRNESIRELFSYACVRDADFHVDFDVLLAALSRVLSLR